MKDRLKAAMSSPPSIPVVVHSLTYLISHGGDALNATRHLGLFPAAFWFYHFVSADFFVVQGVNCMSTSNLVVPTGYKHYHISLYPHLL